MPAIDATSKVTPKPPPPPPPPKPTPATASGTSSTGHAAPTAPASASPGAAPAQPAATPAPPSVPDTIAKAAETIGSDLSNALKSFFDAKPSPGSQPPSQVGVPPAGTTAVNLGQGSASNPATTPSQGTLFSRDDKSQGGRIFNDNTNNGDSAAYVRQFIDGSITKMPGSDMSSSDKNYINSLSVEQRTQIAMQQMGPEGTASYLANLQRQQDGELPGSNYVADPKGDFNTFQQGFNALVRDGKISNDDVRALAAAPAQLQMDAGLSSGNPNGYSEGAEGAVSKLFAGLGTDVNNPKATAAQNAFVGASYDTADSLLKTNNGKPSDDSKNLANLLYASGTQVLAATPGANQSLALYNMSPDRIQSIVSHSLQGEAQANSALVANSDEDKTAPPFSGTSAILKQLAADGYTDAAPPNNRLPYDSKQQQDITAAYKGALDALGPDSGASFNDLRSLDQHGSGTRIALSELYGAGMPGIVRSDAGTGPNLSKVSTDFGRFSEYEMGGQYANKSDGDTISQNLGAAVGEYYGDLRDATKSGSTANLFAKYGSDMFTSANGGSSDLENQLNNGSSVLGAMLGGANQGQIDLAARDAKPEDDKTAVPEFLGAFAIAAGTVAIAVAPESLPLVETVGNSLVAAGSVDTAGVIYAKDFPGADKDAKDPTLTWNSRPVGTPDDFNKTEFGYLFNQIDNDAGLGANAKSDFRSAFNAE